MNKMKWAAVALMLGAAVAAQAQTAAKPNAPVLKDAIVMEDQILSRFKVLAVDVAKRQLQLKTGELTFKIRVRAGVPIDKIKVGDDIDAMMVVREVLALRKGDGISKSETSVVEAPDGSLEGLRIDHIYNVVAVDANQGRIRLSDAYHRMAWLKVRSPDVMKDVKVGDQVRAVLTVVEVAGLQAKP
ncbi:hypothetical protein PSQ40_00455 [Curvibacter sp. HBC61]|uniref:DUF5666 domain-containing protein n=1 Tax=Curvibacter cyanobacteriorum TaxID=3026422 RepID=A0ABT5MSL2_9BURK|nr:hypothetical protein [Curvibacter sp. HBC61]MDD0837031.1 hypothetical protein [Curvibacter sp. HBC61]